MNVFLGAMRAAMACAVAMLIFHAAAAADPNPFDDVSPSDPAYQAVVRLYHEGLIKGYPNGYFDGKRLITRYEMAIIVDRAVTELEAQLGTTQTAFQVTQDEIADARYLLNTYGDQIKGIQAKQAALTQTTTTLASTLDKAQIHFYSYLRAPGTYSETVTATTPTGATLPANTLITDGVSNYVTGTNARGTGIQVLRLIVSGNLDKQTSYAIRLENKNYFGQANVNGLDTLNPTETAYNDQGFLRLNYFYARYQFSHSPLYAIGGKYPMSEDLGLAYSNDYYNGGLLGFTGRLNGFIGFGEQGGPDLGSTSPFAYVPTGAASTGSLPHTQFAVNGHLEEQFSPKFSLGANFIDLQALPQKIYSPKALNFISFNQPLAAGSIAANASFTPFQALSVEYLERFGDNPVTKQGWTDNHALWAQYVLGSSTAIANANNLELGFARTGSNSVVNNNTGLNGTPFYTGYYTAQANDRHMVYAGLNHFVSTNLRVSIDYVTWGLNVPELIVPSKTIPAGSVMSVNNNHAVFLNTQVTL